MEKKNCKNHHGEKNCKNHLGHRRHRPALSHLRVEANLMAGPAKSIAGSNKNLLQSLASPPRTIRWMKQNFWPIPAKLIADSSKNIDAAKKSRGHRRRRPTPFVEGSKIVVVSTKTSAGSSKKINVAKNSLTRL